MAIAFVSRTAKETLGAATTATPAQAHVAGNLLVVGLSRQSATAPTIADTAGNTYTKVTSSDVNVGGNFLELWYAKNILGNAANIVTVTWNGGPNFEEVSVLEFSGAHLTAPLDDVQIGTGGTGTALATASIGVTASADVIVAFMIMGNGTGAGSGGAGYTWVTTNLGSKWADEYHLVTAAETATATQSGSNVWAITGASFKVASAPGRRILMGRH